jgi:hypothetical protein
MGAGLMLRRSSVVYRRLLRLYPTRFRGRYAAEVADVFDSLCEDVYHKRGMWGLLGLWPAVLADLFWNVVAEHLTGGKTMIQRWFDMTLSLGMIFIGLSVFPLVALLIKLDSPGPLFYRAEKLGKDGRRFYLLKLRSMVHGTTDREITRIGYFLRQSHLDEWPQFVNILTGEMTLIGPRPQNLDLPDDLSRLTTRPGLMPSLLRLH